MERVKNGETVLPVPVEAPGYSSGTAGPQNTKAHGGLSEATLGLQLCLGPASLRHRTWDMSSQMGNG